MDWGSKVTGPLTVPFTVAAFYADAAYAKAIWSTLALVAAFLTLYFVWAKERKRVCELEGNPDDVRLHAEDFILGMAVDDSAEKKIRGFLRLSANNSGRAINLTSIQLFVVEDDDGGTAPHIDQPIPLIDAHRGYEVWPIDLIPMPQKGEFWATGMDPIHVTGDNKRTFFWVAFESDWFPLRGTDECGLSIGNGSLMVRAQDADTEFYGWRTRVRFTSRENVTKPPRIKEMDLTDATRFTIKVSQNTEIDTNW